MATQRLPDNISGWLVTPSNPLRPTNGLDYVRCAALHNHIVEIGWVGSGRSQDDFVAVRRTWFEAHGDNAAAARENLAPSLVQFLERAYVVPPEVRFFYWVGGLSIPNDPDQLWGDHDLNMADEGEELRFLTLYPVNENLAEHGDGLNYDQKEHKAIMQMDIMDDKIIDREEEDPAPWYALETVLSSWIEMIQMGKITPSPKNVRPLNEKYDPWVNHRYSDKQLREAVDALRRLMDAIESRMPDLPRHHTSRPALLDDETLARAGVPERSFARSLCTTAPRPSFKYIAPGLLVPMANSFASGQSFTSVENDDEDRHPIPPVLLFRAQGQKYKLADGEMPFHEPYNTIRDVPPGLYIADADLGHSNVSENSAVLVLPFCVGENALARKSDRSRFENGTDLYQLGYPPFGGDPRPQRLVKVLENWLGMVNRGDWEVGAEGVVGGVEKFREADTEAHWEKYWIPPSW